MRKRWTPRAEATQAISRTRIKQKWQIALRRYILEKHKSSDYAPYFGLDTNSFRLWIALQFRGGMSWENFSSAWQFDQVVPLAYFDLSNEQDLRLCWNFSNVRAAPLSIDEEEMGAAHPVLTAKAYFQHLMTLSEYPIFRKMVQRIETIEKEQLETFGSLNAFVTQNREALSVLADFGPIAFDQLNGGLSLGQISTV